MDHSWGRNVWESGLSSTGATIASCFLGNPLLWITNEKVPFTNQCRAWIFGPDMDDAIGPALLGIIGTKRTFPYGFNVEPDVPL